MNPNRRNFIKLIVVSAGSAAVAGCGGGDSISNIVLEIAPPSSTPLYFPQSVASGDPKQTSIIVWTRIIDTARPGDLPVQLQVATDPNFTALVVDAPITAVEANDNCVKVRVTGLNPGLTYYYRFTYQTGNLLIRSRVGRTKTALPLTDNRAVRFAFLSCQDYTGRFYNSLLRLLEPDYDNLDFIVHLGDYIYETTGDPSFQSQSGRRVVFTDERGAIRLGSGQNSFFAAQSLSNYRDLYKIYRSDAVLQQLHEKFPWVTIWDDHEFSDDSWRDNGTYFDGRVSETSTARKRNAEQVYFEYMPIDHAFGNNYETIGISNSQLYPNTRIYRDFRFGANVLLILSDYRSYRPDHLIPEDAYPGTVALTRQQIIAAVGQQFYDTQINTTAGRPSLAYINIDDAVYAQSKAAVLGATIALYQQAGLTQADAQQRATAVVRGNLNLFWVNQLLQAAGLPAIALSPTFDAGIAFLSMGKQGVFGELGSRYLVVKSSFDLYAGILAATNPASQDALGAAQLAFIQTALTTNAQARWKILGSSVSFTPLVLNLTQIPNVPPPFNQVFYLNAEHWDGFPQAKAQLLQTLAQAGVISIAGDIHSAYVSEHVFGNNKTFCFTGPSVSSTTFNTFVRDAAASVNPALVPLTQQLDSIIQAGDPSVRLAQTNTHGVVVVEANATELTSAFSSSATTLSVWARLGCKLILREPCSVAGQYDGAGVSNCWQCAQPALRSRFKHKTGSEDKRKSTPKIIDLAGLLEQLKSISRSASRFFPRRRSGDGQKTLSADRLFLVYRALIKPSQILHIQRVMMSF